MRFELEAKIKFEADDIDDACAKLSKHFLKLKTGEESDLFCVPQDGQGKIEIHPG